MITVLILVEAFSKPTRFRKAALNRKDENSVWIVPGGVDADGDIDRLVAWGGIRILERVSSEEAERCAEHIQSKFEMAGFAVKRALLCND
jgi:hypothetical protein